MKGWLRALALTVLGGGAASAATLDFGVAQGPYGPYARVGVLDYQFGRSAASFSVSTRAVEAALETGIDLSVLGSASARLGGSYAYRGGGTLTGSVRSVVGPVALNVRGRVWSVPPGVVEPLSQLEAQAWSTAASGWAVDADSRYRLRRDLVLQSDLHLGLQPNGAVQVEWLRGRQLLIRGGARVGENVLGALAGVTWRDEGYTVSADALLGPSSVAATGSVAFLDPLPVPSGLRLYVTYEPWRLYVPALRYGAELSADVGLGYLTVEARGSEGLAGVRFGYELPWESLLPPLPSLN